MGVEVNLTDEDKEEEESDSCPLKELPLFSGTPSHVSLSLLIC